MRQVLIVDDETMIREGLRYVIDWKAYGFEIVGTAENGEIGLEKIEKLKPDVVIADIKMPGKNGLEMINAALEKDLSFYSIILSGYSDFEYARQAIQLGAVNYLLKPVNEDELIDILQLIDQKETLKQQKNQAAMWHEKLFGSDSTGVEQYHQAKLLRLSEDVEIAPLVKGLSLVVDEVLVLTFRHDHYVIMLTHETGNDLAIEALCQELLPKKEVIISRWVPAGENLKSLTEELQTLSAMSFLLPKQLVSQASLEDIRSQHPMIKNAREQLLKTIFARQGLKTALHHYWQNLYYDLATEEDIKWRVNRDLEWIYQQITGKVPIEIQWSSQGLNEQIYLAQTFPMLKEIIFNQLEKLTLTISGALNHLDIVSELIKYTKENYQEELTLKKVGELFNYNSAYLGKKFRKETGENYLSFLDQVRMEKASDILAHSNFMVYEVAEMVGYNNSDYFYKKFKQHFKVSPNEFRNNLTKI